MVTNREKEILRLLCFKDAEIAERLFIEKCTVKTHIHRLIDKFLVNSRKSLLIEALKQKVITLDEIITE